MDMDQLLRGLGPVQDSMKAAMKKTDAERAAQVFEGSAGGGAVKVRITGALGVERVTIAPAAATAAGGDVAMLEDLVQAAIADALRQHRQKYGATAEEQMQKLSAGQDLAGMLGPLLGKLGR
jgi:DNA-binding protein YbaB